jgi:head-tail adaptor
VIGQLRHRVEILAPERLADGAGGARLAWTPVETLWAGLQHLPSVRDTSGARIRRLRRIAATMRWRPTIALGRRLRFDGALFDIVSVESEGGREPTVTLICEEASP